MSAGSEHDKKVADKVAKKLDNQRERAFQLDTSKGGGPNMPRPSPEFTNQFYDAPASVEKIHETSHAEAWREELDKLANNERAAEIASKMEGRQERAEEPQQKSSIMDRIKERLSKDRAETSATKSKEKDNGLDR